MIVEEQIHKDGRLMRWQACGLVGMDQLIFLCVLCASVVNKL